MKIYLNTTHPAFSGSSIIAEIIGTYLTKIEPCVNIKNNQKKSVSPSSYAEAIVDKVEGYEEHEGHEVDIIEEYNSLLPVHYAHSPSPVTP